MGFQTLFIAGAGAGKTHACIEQYRKAVFESKSGIECRCFFILPSREHAERIQHLILKDPLQGMFNARILTINDFACHLAQSWPAAVVSQTLRKNIIRDILSEAAGDGPFLYFGPVKEKEGFWRLLSDTIGEFKSSLLSIEEFERKAQPLLSDPAFLAKFRDFCVLIKRYELHLARLGLVEAEDHFLEFLKTDLKPKVDLVVFDGFYHFSRSQQLLIKALTHLAERMIITLTMDPGQSKARAGLFEYPSRTRDYLESIGFKTQCWQKKNRRTDSPAIAHLERNLFKDKPARAALTDGSIEIISAPDVFSEVDWLARKIRELMFKESYAFCDFCVILRRIGSYEKILSAVFKDAAIPVVIHERKKVIEHGFSRTLWLFLNGLAEDPKREDLLAILRSSYLRGRVDQTQLAEWESFCIQKNSRQADRVQWRKLWTEPQVQSLPVRLVCEKLFDDQERLLSSRRAREFSNGLLKWVRGLCGPVLKTSVSVADQIDERLYRSVEIMLDQATLLWHKRSASDTGRTDGLFFDAKAFSRGLQQSLEAGLFSYRPKGKNRVQVYDAVMALPKEYPVVFLSGLLEKSFPQECAEDPLFTDRERQLLNRDGVVLEPRAWRQSGERYFFYMAAGRAKKKLILTAPAHDDQGRPNLKSFFIEEVQKCFTNLPVSNAPAWDQLAPQDWQTRRDVFINMSYRLFEPVEKQRLKTESFLRLVHQSLVPDAQFGRIIEWGRRANRAFLESPNARKLFEGLRFFSASRLESYAICPFKFFCERMLLLSPPPEDLEAAWLGNFLHEVLEKFYEGMQDKQKNGEYFEGALDGLKKRIFGIAEGLWLKTPFGQLPLYRQKVTWLTAEEILSAFIEKEAALWQQRGFVPTCFELAFGQHGQPCQKGMSKPPLKISQVSEAREILIEGRIDRIDIGQDPAGKPIAILIDYKTSRRAKSLAKKLRERLELQLPLYASFIQQNLGWEVVAAELRYLRQDQSEGIYRKNVKARLGLTGRNFYSDKEFEGLLQDAQETVRLLVERIRQGRIEVFSKSCDFCPYDNVCRFEKWQVIYNSESLHNDF